MFYICNTDRFAIDCGILALQLSGRIHHVLCQDFRRRSQFGYGENHLHPAAGFLTNKLFLLRGGGNAEFGTLFFGVFVMIWEQQ